jgi:acyl-CoA reductase-like NAD-dependent aldehyde dehydrogenase
MTNYERFNKIYIDGTWRKGTDKVVNRVKNPYNGDVIAEIQCASEQDVSAAYEAAARAQKLWESSLPQERRMVLEKAAVMLEERRDEILDLLVRESGSTRIKSEIEWGLTLSIIKESATFPLRVEGKILPSMWPGKENRLYRKPAGVVGVISPWNFPLYLSMRSIAPALATGNGVVLKPDSATPICGGLLIAEIFEKAGLPNGLLNVVVGEGSEIGDIFVQHPVPRVISFTGSTRVGRHVAQLAAKHLKHTALELGGNNVFIVMEDADIEKAVRSAVFGKFLHQGQVCLAINRILVHEGLYEEFIKVFAAQVKILKVGDPSEKDTVIGPLINEEQLERIQRQVEESIHQGAGIVLQGEVRGTIMAPIILRDVTNEMPIVQNEIFGPVAAVIRFRDEQEVINIADASEHGLSGAIHSRDLERALRMALQIRTGMIHINDQPVNDEAHMAFGGEKSSGLGRFGGEWVLDKFTTVQWISVQHAPRIYPTDSASG